MCFPNLRPYNTHKLQFKSIPCTFLGYSTNHKGYRCLSPSGRIFISRDVVFDESKFPFASLKSSSTPSNQFSSSSLHVTPSIPTVSVSSSAAPIITDVVNSSTNPLVLQDNVSLQGNQSPLLHTPLSTTSSTSSTTRYMLPSTSSPSLSSDSSTTRYMLPPQTPIPSSLPNSSSITVNDHSMITRGKKGIHKPKAYLSVTEPTTVTTALKDPKWLQAMKEEYSALLKNNTWQLVSLPPGKSVIGCKWIFRVKQHSDDSIDRYKARLVAKGFHQTPGFDFSETFSPVIKPVTVQIVLSIAITKGWPNRQLEVNNAFQPPGFSTGDSNVVCKLNKSLYGLKQAPRHGLTHLPQLSLV